MKYFILPVFLIFFCENLFSQYKPYPDPNDSLLKERRKYYNFVSVQPMRFFINHYVLFYERRHKAGRATEIGIGYITPSDNLFIYMTGATYKSANYKLYGYSFYLGEKWYDKYNFYWAPEFIFRYEYNDNIEVLVAHDPSVFNHVNHRKTTLSLSGKVGWKDRLGLIDLFLGVGINGVHTNTQYLEDPRPGCGCPEEWELRNDNGLYYYPLIRIGIKVGFPF